MQGKTLTALALVVSDPRGPVLNLEETQVSDQTAGVFMPPGGTLILCPKSTLWSTWEAEIRRRLVWPYHEQLYICFYEALQVLSRHLVGQP